MFLSCLLRLTAAFAAIAVLAVPSQASAFQSGYPVVESTGTVYRAVDGDTFVVNLDDREAYARLKHYANGDPERLEYFNDRYQSIRVRLANTNTKESVHRDRSRNTAEGRQVSAIAKELFNQQPTRVQCFDWGDYGRAICTMALPNGQDYGEWLIRQDYSPYVTRWGTSPFYHDRYREAARQ